MHAHEIVRRVRAGEMSPVEVTRRYLERVTDLNPKLNAYITINPEALSEAEAVAERMRQGEALPLAGVPVAVKDNIVTRGLRTTCASKSLERFVPPYDATVIQRLREAGAVILGKTNLDEFAMGSSCEYSHFGATRNPWDLERVPGGSSGGSAAAVAADLAPVALGSDTGGSVRQPAAFTGVLGFKPTYGRVSRYGLVAFASSLDQIGPFARSTRDLALLMDVIAGPDPRDATSLEVPPRFVEALEARVEGLTIGMVKEALEAGNTPGVLEAVERFRTVMEGLGVRFVEVSLPSLEYALAAYYLVATSEASSNLARYDGTLFSYRSEGEDLVEVMMRSRAEGFGPEVRRRVLMGTFALSSGYYDAYYGKALKARRRIYQDFEAAFAQADVLLTPTSPTPAFKLGEKTQDPLAMYLSDTNTVAVNLAGLPGLSLPAGNEDGLPVAVQLIGRALEDERLFTLSMAFERATDAAYLQVAPVA
ncbi:Asp-tRNA(Asn)/Glu-tRNA(Gln) amidotransferase subunit GatA [Marinithermus hydrothermalis]|uniref:Glutamyl-tRNA(Gln) amidotransferase subunit A n=1 Tax=Marinithermus hydrothermalis (strain DSM 14884 / JCM 11576 / T1) TaxID=869210 RepID=F2NL93_MARHT|nr:Asp-tRNA(Asn)/Glu-tRNA(Gln) amidotransferase subunit GatA [Marinithermus hydrothermalis]AEB11712.1 Glutamyl-tRNA(Gln) amidotransferase subunit A [Marinithermus hydrothermalis DSM 14884]